MFESIHLPRAAGPQHAAEAAPDWSHRRDLLRAWLNSQPLGLIGEEEVEAHFAAMPPHYWEVVTETDLVWGLQTIHQFLGLVANTDSPATMPVLDWRHLPNADGTRVMLCTWDRSGLLAKAAACFSATKLNIQQAAIYTRADHIVMDVFRICDADRPCAASTERLEQMRFLLDGALSEPQRFASVWACSRHKYLAPAPRMEARIAFDNGSSPSTTVIRIEAGDRLGLLYDMFEALANLGLDVTQADIETDGELAHDVLHVVDHLRRKVTDPARLQSIRRSLEQAIGG